jgi:hypothetical protein
MTNSFSFMGNVGIGTASPNSRLQVNSLGAAAVLQKSSDVTGNLYLDYRNYAGTEIAYVGYGSGSTDVFYVTNTLGAIVMGGNVGIGISPSYQLQLSTNSAGKPGGGSWTDSSDVRLKRNVSGITGALDRLTKLRGVNYEWINPGEHGNLTGLQAGLIAQDVEKVFPEWVGEINSSGKDMDLVGGGKIKTLELPYGFNAYVVEAVKELKEENDMLKSELCRKDSTYSWC